MNQPADPAPARLPGDLLGTRVGRYRLSQRIGEGGMGVVYLGLDERQRAVAVKVLRPHVAGDPDARRRLAREVATLQRVRHDRIAQVLDADVDGPLPYVVTQYVPAVSLDAHVRDHGPLRADQLIRLGFGLGDALGAIHGAGVIHRDLKPANVMMSDGDPVVIDFGIAHVADDSRLTMTGLVMGTPGYLSPELIEGGSVDRATDWWGWAATMAFAATARPPFGRGPMEVVLDRVRRGEADLDGVPDSLVDVLRSALSPDPAKRPRPGDLRGALSLARESLHQAPTQAVSTASSADDQTQIVPATVLNRASAGAATAGTTTTDGRTTTQVGEDRTAPVTGAAGGVPTAVSAVPPTQVSAVPPTQVSAAAPPTIAAVPRRSSEAGRRRLARGSAPAASANLPVGQAQPVVEPRRSYAHDAVARHAPPAAAPPPHVQQAYAQPQAAQRAQAYPPTIAAPPQHFAQGPTREARPVAVAAPPAGARELERHQQRPPVQQPPTQPPGQYGGQPDGQDPTAVRRPARAGTMIAALVLLIAGFLTAPVVTLVGFIGVSALARTADRISWSVLKRRHRFGRRVSDIFYGIVQSPLQLVAGSFWAVFAALLPTLLAICGFFAVTALLPADGTGLYALTAPAAAGLVYGLAHWWGAGGAAMRRGSRTLARTFTPGKAGSVFAVCLLLILTVAVLSIRYQAGGPTWYPFDVDPLTKIVGVTPSDLLRVNR